MPIINIAKEYGYTLSVDTAWDESIKLDAIKKYNGKLRYIYEQ
jgi:hypothetical protein